MFQIGLKAFTHFPGRVQVYTTHRHADTLATNLTGTSKKNSVPCEWYFLAAAPMYNVAESHKDLTHESNGMSFSQKRARGSDSSEWRKVGQGRGKQVSQGVMEKRGVGAG